MTRFITIETNPVPPRAEVNEMRAGDGARLRTAFFPAETPRGTVVVAPGWMEFIEKYFEVAGDLNERGLNAAIMDWRGQGLSDRTDRWDGYMQKDADDLRVFLESAVAPRFAPPYLLLTHSMGGIPALLLLAQGFEGFSRAVLTAPLTRLFPPAQNALFGVAARAACSLGFENAKVTRGPDDSQSFEGNMFTTDPARHGRFRALLDAAPETYLDAPTYGWIRETMRASKAFHQPDFFNALKAPIRIISAERERRIDGGDHAAIAAASPLIEHVVIKDALHEIMMERDEIRALFWEKVDEFFAPALAPSQNKTPLS